MSGSKKRKRKSSQPPVRRNRGTHHGVVMSDLPAHQWLKRVGRTKLDGTLQPPVIVEISDMTDFHLCGAVRMLIREFRARTPLDLPALDYGALLARISYPQWPELLKEIQKRDPGHGVTDHTEQERCVADICGLGSFVDAALAACVRMRLDANRPRRG